MILKKIAVIGGDERSCVCADLFAGDGSECAVFGLENSENECCATKCRTLSDALCESDAVLLPLPVMRDSAFINTPLSEEKITVSDIFANIGENALIFAGNPGRCFFAAAEAAKSSSEIINYAANEVFSILGCVPTAEGTCALIPKLSGQTVCGSKILVTGCGRVGRSLSLLLRAMGAEVFVSARKESDLAWIEANGMHSLKTYELCDQNVCFDVICNTIPTVIFDKKVLSSLRGKPVIIELASKPYGVGFR